MLPEAAGRISAVVGEQLLDFRKRRDMTQAYVAEIVAAMGYAWTASTVSLIESGKRRLTVDELVVLSAVLGFPAAEILSQG